MEIPDRDMRLLDGRRVQLTDLIEAGYLDAGATLEFVRPRLSERYVAEVTEDGRLRLPDGREYAAPSRAAMEAAGLRAIDGWLAWTVLGTDDTLLVLRQRLLDETAVATTDTAGRDGEVDGDDRKPDLIEARHDVLTAARAAAQSGKPTSMTVKELIGLWGARGRGYKVIDRIEADLDNYSLVTRPDYRKVSADTVVEIVPQLAPVDEALEDAATAPAADDAEIGLTLGNVPSALAGVSSIHPDASLDEAVTRMMLDDYSQLAVMPTKWVLSGAVTWRSIAKALAHDSRATLASAIEPAAEHPYDRDLVDVLAELSAKDFVFVRGARNEVTGIVTTADVVRLYDQLATPYFIIGEIDHLLRRFVADTWSIEDVVSAVAPEGRRRIVSHDDLSFGDYQWMLSSEERFADLGWPLHRKTFIDRLDEVREIRNGVAHFDPDPVDPTAVAALRNFLDLLRNLRAHA